MTARPRYDARAKDEAVALARLIGPTDAGRQLGIPHTSISRWMAQGFSAPEVEAHVVATEDAAARLLWETVTRSDAVIRKAIARADAKLDDPKLSARDAASIARDVSAVLERAAGQWQLLTGRVTERVATQAYTTPTPEEEERYGQDMRLLRSIRDASDEEIDEWIGSGAAAAMVRSVRGPLNE